MSEGGRPPLSVPLRQSAKRRKGAGIEDGSRIQGNARRPVLLPDPFAWSPRRRGGGRPRLLPGQAGQAGSRTIQPPGPRPGRRRVHLREVPHFLFPRSTGGWHGRNAPGTGLRGLSRRRDHGPAHFEDGGSDPGLRGLPHAGRRHSHLHEPDGSGPLLAPSPPRTGSGPIGFRGIQLPRLSSRAFRAHVERPACDGGSP